MEVEDQSDRPQETGARPQQPARRHIPPVIVDDFKGVLGFLKLVMPTMSLACTVTRRKSRYVFQAKCVEDYERLISALDGRKLPYFTFGLDKARDLRRVIRGLPVDASVGEIEADLRLQGIHPRVVKQLTKPSTNGNVPIPLFLIVVERAKDPEEKVDRLTSICHLRVQIEPSKSSGGPPQCHRCLGFNHSSQHCRRNLRCLRCGEAHIKEDCPRSREEAPRCANCKGEHIACYGGCPVRKQVIASRRPQATTQDQPPRRDPSGPSTSRQDWPRLPQRPPRAQPSRQQEAQQQQPTTNNSSTQQAQRPRNDPARPQAPPLHTHRTLNHANLHRPPEIPGWRRVGTALALSRGRERWGDETMLSLPVPRTPVWLRRSPRHASHPPLTLRHPHPPLTSRRR